VPSETATVGEHLLFLELDGLQRVEIQSIKQIFVPASELVAVYTESGAILVNGGLLASCKSEYDLSEYHLGALSLIFNYVSTSGPQKLAEIASKLRITSALKYLSTLF